MDPSPAPEIPGWLDGIRSWGALAVAALALLHTAFRDGLASLFRLRDAEGDLRVEHVALRTAHDSARRDLDGLRDAVDALAGRVGAAEKEMAIKATRGDIDNLRDHIDRRFAEWPQQLAAILAGRDSR